MAEGVDFATPASVRSVQSLAKSVKFVARYLCPADKAFDWKRLGPGEVAAFKAAKVPVVLVWETSANRALQGEAAGKADAQAALNLAVQRGFDPQKVRIHFAVDFDATPAQQKPINAYFQGAAQVIPLARLGAYGGYWPLKRLKDAGLISFFWQAMAWSGTNLDKRATLFQYHNGGSVAGLSVDHDRSLKADFGQNPAPRIVVPVPLPVKRTIFKVDVQLSNGNHIIKTVKYPALYLAKINLARTRPTQVTITRVDVK